MGCTRTEDLLSAYLDGDLPERERESVAEHIRQCHRCAGEERALRETLSLLRNLPPENAPPGLLEGVRGRIGDSGTEKPLWKKLFLPAHIKIPLEAAAVVLIFLLAYGIQNRGPATKTPPSAPGTLESRKPDAGIATGSDRRKEGPRPARPFDVAKGEVRPQTAAAEPEGEAFREKERATAPGPSPEKSPRHPQSELPAVPATRVSTGGGTIKPASPKPSSAGNLPAFPLFAAPPSRLRQMIPHGRDVIVEVAPDARPGMEERIVALALRMGGAVHPEEARPGEAGAGGASSGPDTVRVHLPADSADAFLRELETLGSIPPEGFPGRLDTPAGPTRGIVAYRVRIRVR